MTDTASQRRLERILTAHPNLTSDGFSCGHQAPARGCRNLSCGDQVKTGLSHARLRLPRAAAVIKAVADLLGPYVPADRATTRSPGSYQLKHAAEHCLADHPVARGYVANGEFIAAALLAGFPVKPEGGGSPNALIGMRQADARDLTARGTRD